LQIWKQSLPRKLADPVGGADWIKG